ncbi:MAG: carbohydrate ABC transporter permease [Rhodobacteraceae bacterium]|nr:carbohydrate ABC transporter permease [Paracoccaceae bacterium]MCF8520957.1 carbohydrate ABC transporter permease [Paracoccaceae bacterium]
MRKRDFSIKQFAGVTMMLAFLTFALLPIVWAIILSFRPTSHLFEPIWQSPTALTWENFKTLGRSDFPHALFNSLITAGSSTILAMIIGVPAGFALAKGRSHRKFIASWALLLLRMAPPVGFVIPLFLIYMNVGLLDTWAGLTAAYLVLTLPMVVWSSWTSLSQIPNELIEASLLDGASLFQTLVKVVLPAARPGIVATAVLAFLIAWNDFFFALIITRSSTVTAPVAIMNFVSYASVDWGSIALASIALTLPTVPVIIFANKYIVQSMGGAVKG